MIFLFLGIALCSSTIHSNATASSIELPLTEIIIQGDAQFEKNVMQILKELGELKIPFKSGLLIKLGLWGDWEIGKDLLTKLNELLRFRNKQLIIKSGEETLFDFKTFTISVNTNKTSKVPSLILPADSSSGTKKYKIGSSDNPICVTVGHELIHAIHSLEDKSMETFGEDYKMNNCLGAENTRFWPLLESEYRSGWNALCVRLEEQRTVLGTAIPAKNPITGEFPSRDEFSEFWLRLASRLFPRYVYQDASRHFLENADCVDFIMQRLIGINWEDRILAHCNRSDISYDFQPSAPEAASGTLAASNTSEAQRTQVQIARSQAFAQRLAARHGK